MIFYPGLQISCLNYHLRASNFFKKEKLRGIIEKLLCKDILVFIDQIKYDLVGWGLARIPGGYYFDVGFTGVLQGKSNPAGCRPDEFFV